MALALVPERNGGSRRGEARLSQAYRLLRAILATAESDRLIGSNPCRIVGAGSVRDYERPYLSPEQLHAIVAGMGTEFDVPIKVMLGAHLRVGELVAMQRGDFDTSRGVLRVERQSIVVGDKEVVTETKTGQARDVALPPSAARVLVDHLDAMNGFGRAPLFMRGDGSPLPRYALQRAWTRGIRAARLDGYHLHDIRHTGLTLAAVAGATQRELMARVGHRTNRAASIYQHIADGRLTVIANALDSLMKVDRGRRAALAEPIGSHYHPAERALPVVDNATSPALERVLQELEEEGVEDEREQLILWLIRNQYGVGAEDSYASILSEPEIFPGAEVDAVLVTTRRDLVSPVYVLLGDSAAELKGRVSALAHSLRAESAPEARLAKTNGQLRSLFEPATDRRIGADVSRLILCVCTADAGTPARNALVGAARGIAEVDVIDRRFIDALAEADLSPTTSMPQVAVEVDPATILNLGMKNTAAIITPVPADQIAQWAGIADRTLFDLNVRYALGLNRVRRSLDEALQDRQSADEFIAYHNGITAVCSNFRVTNTGLVIDGLSVVNGAQTVVAIHANAGRLAPGLRVLFKLVQAAPDTELASNIAIRSNTQNPVTSRNLRALDEVQSRLQSQLGARGWVYTRRPNDREAVGDQVIRNDDVAQLLCSIYVRKPALAVKRQVLFEYPLYGEIFPTGIDPARLIFATLLRRTVEEHKDLVPGAYQRAWALTALTIVNMAAEAIRDDALASETMLAPSEAAKDPDHLRLLMTPFVKAACSVLRERHDGFSENQIADDFKVAFKQTRTLTDLAMQASKTYRRERRSVEK